MQNCTRVVHLFHRKFIKSVQKCLADWVSEMARQKLFSLIPKRAPMKTKFRLEDKNYVQ